MPLPVGGGALKNDLVNHFSERAQLACWQLRVGCIEKSAEFIVLIGNEKGKPLMVSQVRKD
jgi:hypothetical protein